MNHYNNNYWQEYFILQFSSRIQEAIKEKEVNDHENNTK